MLGIISSADKKSVSSMDNSNMISPKFNTKDNRVDNHLKIKNI